MFVKKTIVYNKNHSSFAESNWEQVPLQSSSMGLVYSFCPLRIGLAGLL